MNRPKSETVAQVTGAARGIGLAVSRALAGEGLRVAALDRDELVLRDVVTVQRSEGLDVSAFPVDLSDSRAVEQTVAAVEATLGPIATLASVAGILRVGSVCEFSDRDWDDTFASNVSATFYVCRSVATRMLPEGSCRAWSYCKSAARSFQSSWRGESRLGSGASCNKCTAWPKVWSATPAPPTAKRRC